MKLIHQIYTLLLKIFLIFTKPLRESNGEISSIRIVMVWAMYITHDLIYWWKGLINDEVKKEVSNVTQLENLIYPIVALLVGTIIGKIIQKFVEPKNTSDNDTESYN
jgi:hypothetical protein